MEVKVSSPLDAENHARKKAYPRTQCALFSIVRILLALFPLPLFAALIVQTKSIEFGDFYGVAWPANE